MNDSDALDQQIITADTPAKTKKIVMSGKTWTIPYHEYTGGRVIDWNSPVWTSNPSEGVIIISAKDPGKFQGCALKPFVDKESGIKIGWATGKYDESTRQPELGSVRVSSLTTTLNLKNLRDRKLYIFISRNPMISGSPNVAHLGSEINTMFLIDDKEQSAQEQTLGRKFKIQALQYLNEADDLEIEGLARATGNMQEGEPTAIVRNNLEAYAEKSPKVFMEFVNSKDKAYKITMSEAEALGVIEHDPNTGFTFQGIPIGLTKDSVLDHLKKNTTTFREMSRLVDQRRDPNSSLIENVMSEENPEPVNADLLRENEELKRKLKEAEEKKDLIPTTPDSNSSPDLKNGHVITDSPEGGKYDIDNMGRNALWDLARKLEYPNDEWARKVKTEDMRIYMKEKLGKVPAATSSSNPNMDL